MRSPNVRSRATRCLAALLLAIPIGCGLELENQPAPSETPDGSVSPPPPVPSVDAGPPDAPGNAPPVAASSPLALSVLEDATARVDPQVTDPDTTTLTYTTTIPTHGVVTGSAPPFTYAPTANYFGSDSFDIGVNDGTTTLTVPVHLTVTPVNDAPIAIDALVEMEQDTTETITLDATDVDSQVLTYTLVTQPQHGVLTGITPELTYEPEPFYSGVDSFTFSVSDGELPSQVATVTLTIGHVITCGDGLTEGPEACDDGNPIDTDACRNTCVLAACGDGVVHDGVEACDDGNLIDTDACRNSCASASCGDGVVGPDEQCDDANANNDDECLATCKVASCGDGFVRAGVEQCDDGNASNTDSCLTTCKVAGCGDSFVHAGVEACDDGNTIDTDACRNSCAVASCGDGVVQAGVEQCDDGNASNTDSCLNTCVNTSCGDGFVRAGVEQCDDGNASNTDGCLNTCANAACGDGFTEVGVEQCDDGNASNTDGCLNSCANATCGDGFTEVGVEQCDDANVSNTDACLNVCVAATCLDGFVQAGVEQCDDGNQNNVDSCRNNCTTPLCGDGSLDPGEECDDDNGDDDDGCGHSCLIERCGDRLTQLSRGEACDDGNTVSGDGCDASCLVEPFVTTAAVRVSGAMNCTTAVASLAHRIAVDAHRSVFVAMRCGTSAFVATSHDGGQSFGPPQDLSAALPPNAVSHVAIVATPSNAAHVAILLDSGAVYLRTSLDSGATWSAPSSIGTANNVNPGLALEAFNDDVYVGFSVANGVSVARNRRRGLGSFDTTLASLSISTFDMLHDPVTRRVTVLGSSPPSFRVLLSSDRGVSFGNEVNPPGQQFFSDWALSNGQIFGVGTNIGILGNSTQLYAIPTSAPTTSTAIGGLPQVTTLQSRTIAASLAGDAYVASQLDGGSVQLDRLRFGMVSFDAPRSLAASAVAPAVTHLPGSRGAAVAYTIGSEVYATVQTY